MSGNGKVFISHATADVALVRMVVSFLKEAIGVRDADIFCSSLPGHGIPLAEDFNRYIQEQIDQPSLVLALFTPSYLESKFCLMELGAAWSKSLQTLAIVVPSVPFDDVTKTLGLKQAWRITDHSRLVEFRDNFAKLALEPRSSVTWQEKSETWRRKLPKVLKTLSGPTMVAKVEHDLLIVKNADLSRQKIEQLDEANALIEDLRKELSGVRKSLKNSGSASMGMLICDPDERIAQDLRSCLEDAGFNVLGVARTQIQALSMAFSLKPDIILTEIKLDEASSGIDVVKAAYSLLDCFAIFVTAYPEMILRDDRPQPIALVVKPFAPSELLKTVASASAMLAERRTRKTSGPN